MRVTHLAWFLPHVRAVGVFSIVTPQISSGSPGEHSESPEHLLCASLQHLLGSLQALDPQPREPGIHHSGPSRALG